MNKGMSITLATSIAIAACSGNGANISDGGVEASVFDAADTGAPDIGPVKDASSDVASDVVDAQPSDAALDVVIGCETGTELCGGQCVDVTTYVTDSKNCGVCGHDCQGNACANGMCAPDLMGTNLANPVNLAVDSSNVYFTTIADSTTTSGSVYRCPVTGCPTKLGPMTTGLNNPEAIAVDANRVYWNNAGDISMTDGSVMSCPLTDCGKQNASRTTIAKNLEFVMGIALTSTNIYFGQWSAPPFVTGTGEVDTCPLAGCSGAVVAVLTGQAKPEYITMDATSIYMASGPSTVPYIQSATLPGPSTGTRLYTGNGITDNNAGIANDANDVYFADGFAGTILSCAKSGCTNVVTRVGNLSSPFDVHVDATGIYWIDDSGIETCKGSGCGQPTLLASSTNYPQAR